MSHNREASVEVLHCKACDAPLVLADGDAIECPSCGADTPVPEAYRELQRARHDDVALRAEAERVLRKLDRPPSMIVKVLARVLDLPMLAFMVAYGIQITVFAIVEADAANLWLAPRLHLASPDDVPFGYMLAIACFLILVMAFIPRAFGVFANRRVTARAQLLALLRARPPEVPGGASTCRSCNAPLAIAPNAIVATCSYCGTENAVVLETKIVAATRRVVGKLGKTIAEVARADRAERRATLRLLAKELGRYTLRTVLLGLCFFLGSQETPDKQSTTLGIVGIIATLVLFVFFLFQSIRASAKDDAADRRSGNDVPGWVGIVGPFAMALLLFKVLPMIEALLVIRSVG